MSVEAIPPSSPDDEISEESLGVERLIRVSERRSCRRLLTMLDLAMADGTATWHMGGDGRWTRVHRAAGGSALRDHQEALRGERRLRVVDG